ncbi:MAG: zinc ABC transporter substrate-binding protein [Eubacterium sp.]|nr:zinc ABC transporter substrate-binding protein [Eubacterium sp.]
MKRILSILVAAIYMVVSLVACGSTQAKSPDSSDNNDGKKLKIVATIFPEYDWINEVLGNRADSADVTMLLDNGVDLHSYQPSADDIMKISDCDLFIYVGGESDEWVEDALSEAVNKNMQVINLLEVLGDDVKNEEIVEGMEHDHEHEHEEAEEDHDHEHEEAEEDHDHEHEEAEEDHDHEHEEAEEDHDHDHEEAEEEKDEHVWLSLNKAQTICDAIAASLGKIDADNASEYQKNADAYKSKLASLDKEYADAVAAGSKKTLLFGDRFPFRYLVDDYGLTYYAAFAGCSAETEASFETVIFLSKKVDELGLSAIMTIEGDDHRIAETIRDNTSQKDQEILTMDSMQATTSDDVKAGKTYLSIMQENLTVLKEALKER